MVSTWRPAATSVGKVRVAVCCSASKLTCGAAATPDSDTRLKVSSAAFSVMARVAAFTSTSIATWPVKVMAAMSGVTATS